MNFVTTSHQVGLVTLVTELKGGTYLLCIF